MAGTLTEIKTKYGAETLLLSTGAPMMEFQRYGFEFSAQYGTPNTLASNLCSAPLTMGLESVYGFKSQPEYARTNLILMWGGNSWDFVDANLNVLTDNTLLDPVAQCPSLSSFLCQVEKDGRGDRHAKGQSSRENSAESSKHD